MTWVMWKSCVGPFGDSVSIGEDRCTICTKCTTGLVMFWTHAMVLLGDKAQVEARFSPFGGSANLDVR